MNAVGPCQKAGDDETPIDTDSMIASDFGNFARSNELLGGSCGKTRLYSEGPTTVEALAGAKVKTIRVIRATAKSNPQQVEDLRETLRHVWRSKFVTAACEIEWSEGNWWSTESVLEFEDGARGALITDGVHVGLRDHDGKRWFLRLLPAAQ